MANKNKPVRHLILFLTALLISFNFAVSAYARAENDSSEPDPKIKAALELISNLKAENYEAAVKDFDPTMKAQVPPQRLKQIWEGLLAKTGTFKEHSAVRKEVYGPHTTVRMALHFAIIKLDIKVTFNVHNQVAGFFFDQCRPPEVYAAPSYVAKEAFTEKEVTVGTRDFPLPGTLTIPKGEGPFPVVVLVHGSGQSDRDETYGPNKPFRDLAWGLASQGVGVLRYDKRTLVHGIKCGQMRDFTLYHESIEDAVSTLSVLHREARLDKKRIFVLGHSLGGTVIPRIARRDKEKLFAGFIILAGLTRPFLDTLIQQNEYLFKLDGKLDPKEKEILDQVKTEVERARRISPDTESGAVVLGGRAAYWKDMRDYLPTVVARAITRPVLVLQGERDYQVIMDDYAGWKNAFLTHKKAEFKVFPGLNHFFMKGEGKSSPQEYERAGNMEKEVIDTILNWLKKH